MSEQRNKPGPKPKNSEGKKITFIPTDDALKTFRSWTGNRSAKLNKAIISFKEQE